MKSVLVVCIGNICRSPMGEALIAAALPNIKVSSAGVGALVGQPADALARELMAKRGLDIESHRARQLTSRMCQEADLILVMDEEQRLHINEKHPLTRGKLFRLGEVARVDIPDPYRLGQPAFERALKLIDDGASAWVERIKKLS
ncbi:protein-tyrosine phosphatase [Variovorax boronicumulans]|jgi:protein-tyrosine phosphatase|uniref:protein-tyrosine-phosphatase n=1 Tax=Variovorax boronicumulans TaxID=436515 RepID=A0AAW8D115_9BURK|nr:MULTISPECIES: low molecular weight protein-tyrosine-phosphatase [Variovorax]MDP9894164.1 protein-tyrosine phosphatase [Variovorax boronicumulans]MDP9990109.1 protein-tyrosine phosphatase [Variovorax boronicumulans]MDQ0001383.1 protein-tyrosine phosphatase [Variovorax boronicumulans]MDQ0033388.1 protein-tyrosine phosphatase [Variovorax boronicumulans]MDQ0042691.1 protein-tyrosine phosphatase [Variovorax boronicumulans]